MKRLQIIDSTTITLFSNLLFKGVGRHPKTGKKKGGIKVHTVIHANEGVPSDIKFTSAATNDSFMLRPATLNKGDIMAMDRAYIDYEKFQQLTERGVIYVTKMKKIIEIHGVGRHDVPDYGRSYGGADTECRVRQTKERRRNNPS